MLEMIVLGPQVGLRTLLLKAVSLAVAWELVSKAEFQTLPRLAEPKSAFDQELWVHRILTGV